MKLKRKFFTPVLLFMTAILLGLVGCGIPGAQGTAPSPARGVLSRAHWEITDPQDGLFVTYWEKDYAKGTVNMDLTQRGYTCSIDYTANSNNIVCGKGIKPCYGETISWTTNQNDNADYYGIYGWLREPLIEYYIGRGLDHGGAGEEAGIYSTSQGDYKLFVEEKNQANILNPENRPELPKKFLQFNCQPLNGGYPDLGPVNMAEHYQGWEEVMADWWPTQGSLSSQGWSWYSITTPDYCVVATEVWSAKSAQVSVSNITVSGVATFAHSTFSGKGDGNTGTVETGDNRGYYSGVTDNPRAFFNKLYPELPIQLQFGDTNGTQIEVAITQTLLARMLGPNGQPYIRKITVVTYMGQGTISGDTITVDGAAVNSRYIKQFVIMKLDNNTVSFAYDFAGTNGYSGYGVASRDGGPPSSSSVVSDALSDLTPVNPPVNALPPLGNNPVNMTVTGDLTVYSVVSGQYNGIVKLQFTNPNPATVKQIEVVIVDLISGQRVYDFRAPDSNPYYWGWGGEMRFPQPNTRYTILIKKVVSTSVSFTLQAY